MHVIVWADSTSNELLPHPLVAKLKTGNIYWYIFYGKKNVDWHKHRKNTIPNFEEYVIQYL